ncbi:APH domain-containing protein [Durusdinium trenchii]|uniref:APH domain-containing protein n=1 Tax=Durusdinium trenchii TaxID=1381693 RepID=A0ABP0QWU0_9DINO
MNGNASAPQLAVTAVKAEQADGGGANLVLAEGPRRTAVGGAKASGDTPPEQSNALAKAASERVKPAATGLRRKSLSQGQVNVGSAALAAGIGHPTSTASAAAGSAIAAIRQNTEVGQSKVKSKDIVRLLVKANSALEATLLLGGTQLKEEGRLFDDSSFGSVNELNEWLNANGIETIPWGLGKTKPVAKLFREVNNKTSVLVLETIQDKPVVVRYLRVVRVKLKQDFARDRVRYLVEGSQELGSTGKVRFRNMLLSSMMQYNEATFKAAKRAVEKEMQNISGDRQRNISKTSVTTRRDNTSVHIEDSESPSFPGLLTRYILYTVDAKVDKLLPDTNFCTTEYLPTGHLAIKHHWKWKTRREIEEILQQGVQQQQQQRLAAASQLSPAAFGRSKQKEGTLLFTIAESDFSGESNSISKDFLSCNLKLWGFSKPERKHIMATVQGDTISKAELLETIKPAVERMRIGNRDHLEQAWEDLDVDIREQHFTVLERLFKSSSRVFPRLLHGGCSGSYVLQVQSTAPTGQHEDPVVVKLDNRTTMQKELASYLQLAPYMGDCAPAILAADVDEVDEGKLQVGGIKFELVGAVWMLPDFRHTASSLNANMLNTLKTLFEFEFEHEERVVLQVPIPSAELRHSESADSCDFDMEEPHSPSSPLSPAAITEDAPHEVIKEVFGQVPQVLKEVFGEIMRKTTQASLQFKECSLLDEYYIPKLIRREILQEIPSKKKAKPLDLSLHDPDGTVREEFRTFLDTLESLGDQQHKYAQALIHGDLNGMNVLIDSQDIVWVIDFAYSGTGHALKDICKLESCILFEYLDGHTEAEGEGLRAMVRALVASTDLRNKPELDEATSASLSQRLKFAWASIQTLRSYAAKFVADDPEPLQVVVAMLHFALRALHFGDIERKDLALFAARACAKRLTEAIQAHGSVKGRIVLDKGHVSGYDNDQVLNRAEFEYEKRRCFHDINVKESFIVDLITRERVHIGEQTVELELIEGTSKESILGKNMDVDEMQARRRLQKRLEALKGVLKSSIHCGSGSAETPSSRFTSAMQVLDCSDRQQKKSLRVLLGGAASGKSCLLRRILLSTVQNQSGSENDLVPVLILLIDLGRLMWTEKLTSEDDLIDHYLQSVCGQGSPRLAFLRQARKRRCLLLLFDGLDEAGDKKKEVESYLAKLAGTEPRLVVSSRVTGFNDAIFRDFQFFQVLPLTEEMQHQIIETKLGKNHPELQEVKAELRKAQYLDIVRNPLMLSLLISLVSKQIVKARSASTVSELSGSTVDTSVSSAANSTAESNGQSFTRAFLYKHAVAQLLHESSMAKFGMRRGIVDKEIERSTRILASETCYNYLKRLSFYAHSEHVRDFAPEVLTYIAEQCHKDPVYGMQEDDLEKLFEVISVLQVAVFEGRCALFAVSKVAVEQKLESSVSYVMRFVHLSFQEYLAGMFLVDQLRFAFNNGDLEKTAKLLFNLQPGAGGLLQEPWWQGVIMSMAGSMGHVEFYELCNVLLKVPDPTGGNVLVCSEMLNELGEDKAAPADVRKKINKLMKQGFNDFAKEDRIVTSLMHPSQNLQHIALNEVRKLYDPVQAAYALAFGAGADIAALQQEWSDEAVVPAHNLKRKPWYQKCAAALALGLLPEIKRDSVILRVILDLWTDDSPRVQRFAVEAIKTLGAERHDLVIAEVIRQLRDEVECLNGHELVLALQLEQETIIEELLSHVGLGGEFESLSRATLRQLSLSETVLDVFCLAIGHSESLMIRSVAAEIITHHIRNAAAPVPDTLKTAFIKWLEHPDPKFVVKACESIESLSICSERLVNTLKPLILVRDVRREDVGVWMAALGAYKKARTRSLFKDADFLGALGNGLKMKHPIIRCKSLHEVQNLQECSSDLVDQTLDLLRFDGDVQVRRAALHAAHTFAPARLGALLEQIFTNEQNADEEHADQEIRKVALNAMVEACTTESRAQTVDILGRLSSDPILGTEALAGFTRLISRFDDSMPLVNVFVSAFTQAIRGPQEIAQVMPTLNMLGNHASTMRPYLGDENRDAIISAIVQEYDERSGAFEDDQERSSWCAVLDRLADSHWRCSDSKIALEWFSSGDEFVQMSMLSLVPEDGLSKDLEDAVLESLGATKVDKRVKASIVTLLHRCGRWEVDAAAQAFLKWVLQGNDLTTLAALDALCVNGIAGKAFVIALPQLLQGRVLSIEPQVLRKRSTRDRLSLAVISHVKQSREQASFSSQGSDSSIQSHQHQQSLEQTVRSKLMVQSCILRTIEQIIMHPDVFFSTAELIDFLRGPPNTRLIACAILGKASAGSQRTPEVALELFEVFLAESTRFESSEEQDGKVPCATTGNDEAEAVAHVAGQTLRQHFRGALPLTSNLESLLMDPRPEVRRTALICMETKPDPDILSLIRSIMLHDASIKVKFAAAEVLFHWQAALSNQNADDRDVIARITSFFFQVLQDSTADASAQEGQDQRSYAFAVLVIERLDRLHGLPDDFARLLMRLANTHESVEIRKAIASVLRHVGFFSMPAIESLLDLEITTMEAKEVWLNLFQRIIDHSSGRRLRHKIIHGDLASRLRSFCQPFLSGKEKVETNSKIRARLLTIFSQCQMQVETDTLEALLEKIVLGRVPFTLETFSALLEYMLVASHVLLSERIISMMVRLSLFQKDGESLVIEDTCSSDLCVKFFAEYQIKNDDEAGVFIQGLGHDDVAPFLFDPLLHYFRTKAATSRQMRYTVSSELRDKLDALLDKNQSVEVAFMAKEMRVDFQVKELFTFTMHNLSLRGRADVKQKRAQRQEQQLMRAEEWLAQRARWFPSTSWDMKLTFRNVAEHLKYQRSRITTTVRNVFLNAVCADAISEVRLLQREVFPEVNRLLRDLGVRVEMHMFNPEALLGGFGTVHADTSFSFEAGPRTNGKSTERQAVLLLRQRVAAVKGCAPFMISLITDATGEHVDPSIAMGVVASHDRFAYVQDRAQDDASGHRHMHVHEHFAESVETLERAVGFLQRPVLPTHAMCYFREASRQTLRPTLAHGNNLIGEIKLRATLSMEKRAIASHPYVKVGKYILAVQNEDPKRTADQTKQTGSPRGAAEELVGSEESDGSSVVAARQKFVKKVASDMVLKVLAEFPICEEHRARQEASSEWEMLDLEEEQRFQENCLTANSAFSPLEVAFSDLTPRCRRETFHQLQDLVREDLDSDNNYRHERRAVSNSKFWRADKDLGNEVIVVTGPTGSGRTSVLATFADLCRNSRNGGTGCVLFHSFGVSPASRDLRLSLVRLGCELLRCFPKLQETDHLCRPALEDGALTLACVKRWWDDLLCEASSIAMAHHSRPLLVLDHLLDGVDNPRCASDEEVWKALLPERFSFRAPPGFSIVVSVASPGASKQAEARIDQLKPSRKVLLQPMDRDEVVDMVQSLVGRHGLKASAPQLNQVFQKPGSRNPLFVSMLCEQLTQQCSDRQDFGSFLKRFPQDMPVSQWSELLRINVGNLGDHEEGAKAEAEVDQEESRPEHDKASSSTCPLGFFLSFLQEEIGLHLCNIGLPLLALVGQIEEGLLFELCALSSNTISLSDWRRFCLLIDPLVDCVSVLPCRDQGKRRTSTKARNSHVGGVSGRPAGRFASPASVVATALKAGSKMSRVIRFRNDWVRQAIKKRCDVLPSLHGQIVRFHLSRLQHLEFGNSLSATRFANLKMLTNHAVLSDDVAGNVSAVLLDPPLLAKLFSIHVKFNVGADLVQDFETAIARVEGLDSPATNECLQRLTFAKSRVEANLAEIQAEPEIVKDLF